MIDPRVVHVRSGALIAPDARSILLLLMPLIMIDQRVVSACKVLCQSDFRAQNNSADL
jgi:hypothetical protein